MTEDRPIFTVASRQSIREILGAVQEVSNQPTAEAMATKALELSQGDWRKAENMLAGIYNLVADKVSGEPLGRIIDARVIVATRYQGAIDEVLDNIAEKK